MRSRVKSAQALGADAVVRGIGSHDGRGITDPAARASERGSSEGIDGTVPMPMRWAAEG
ncbi:hypothetical protein [Microbispora rosea]|uniref:hypothetical protein n=1 Tax=Microbispora rosea TaxID=58117 RepID=UPI0013563375|nr:hypothetical protein [Microbispora rosea]